jgi:hypothetical protein
MLLLSKILGSVHEVAGCRIQMRNWILTGLRLAMLEAGAWHLQTLHHYKLCIRFMALHATVCMSHNTDLRTSRLQNPVAIVPYYQRLIGYIVEHERHSS